MSDRLFVSVLGNRNSGKSTTWNTLFERRVKTGKSNRKLQLYGGECCEVFLVSGSPEERGDYAGDILADTNCRIILCSTQYAEAVFDTYDFVIDEAFHIYVQWLNPGFQDAGSVPDKLGLVPRLLHHDAILSMRDGKADPNDRTEEIRQFIFGWAKARGLTFIC